VALVAYGRSQQVTYLPEKARIMFHTTRGQIEVKLVDDGERIEAYGERALLVRGRVSNVVAVEMDAR
jgi:hypothetical protein